VKFHWIDQADICKDSYMSTCCYTWWYQRCMHWATKGIKRICDL